MSVVHRSASPDTSAHDLRPCNNDVLQSTLDAALNDPANRFLEQTGKRTRATMVRESYLAAGGRGNAPEQIAEAIELLHAGSLIVDDIEDDSAKRREHATLHRDVGMPIALNVGNWMYFRSLERLGDAELSRRLIHAMLGRTIRTIRQCHEGQALDLGAAVDALPVTQIYSTARAISRLKTGGLTALCCWLGATAAGGNRLQRQALSRFGMAVGICLQMRNDLQEIHQFLGGQQRFDDLRNARVTWAWAWASKVASEQEVVTLQLRLRDATGDIDQYKQIAKRLIHLVGHRGDAFIAAKLRRELTLLGEHVESTQGLRSVLARIQGKE